MPPQIQIPTVPNSDRQPVADPEAVAGVRVARAQVDLDPVAVGQPVAACNTDRHTRTDRRGSNTGIHSNSDSPNSKGIHNTGNPNNTDNPSPVRSRSPAPSSGLHRSNRGLRNTRLGSHHGRRLRREPLRQLARLHHHVRHRVGRMPEKAEVVKGER